MSANTATIRELRTDFRSVKRKLEAHGTLIITDRGEPAYVLSPVPPKPRKPNPAPEYLARLVKRQPKPFSAEEARRFWEEERGER
jgi:antitoxin (DNA-binding transcriptional repressor) of toxin-antitoxin stability system